MTRWIETDPDEEPIPLWIALLVFLTMIGLPLILAQLAWWAWTGHAMGGA